MQVLPNYYSEDASPQVLYRIKRDLVKVMRDKHHVTVSTFDEHRIRLEWNGEEQSMNIIIPPHLLAGNTLH